MEPQSPHVNPSPEVGAYRAPEAPATSGESISLTPEKIAVTPESLPARPQPSQAPPQMPMVQMPSLPKPSAPQIPQALPANQMPIQAADDDVIEKEWVDKAKRIVNQNKDDPYTQEKEVSKLQADYLKKRYGKELKLSSD